jgi:hypothetical protein
MARTLLTQEEVDNLPHRSRVMICWSGGNGPFKYAITHRNGRTYTLKERADGSEGCGHVVEFVGDRPYNTQVWLPEDE